jgi:tetratricopeptide (TPR) repeat protein
MKTAMSDDEGGDSIEAQIQAHYAKFQREPSNAGHSLAIAELYEKRREYADALPWFERAFDLGGRVDCVLERRILDMRILGLKEEIAGVQRGVEAEEDPANQAKLRALIDRLLEGLRGLIRERDGRGG